MIENIFSEKMANIKKQLKEAGINPDQILETQEDYWDLIKKCEEAGIIKRKPEHIFYPQNFGNRTNPNSQQIYLLKPTQI